MKKIASIALLAFIMTACGGGAKEAKEDAKEMAKKEMASEERAAPAAEETPASADGNVVVLSSNDQMKYDQSEIKVKAGGTVSLTLKHTGSMAKQVMGHNFVLLKADTDLSAFAVEAMSAIDTDYVPANSDAIIASTKLIGGGEEVTITFDTPEAGTYDFLCTFPGHFAVMQGKFIVE
ncbi:MAG: azurin [Bacteroidia bacterium]|nr:azurin [Bacteroidia bacterium]